MPDSFTQLKELFRRQVSGFFDNAESFTPHPYRDWAILCVTAGIVLLVLLSLSGFMFLRTASSALFGGETSVDTASLQQTIDRQELERILSIYNEREEALERLKASRPAIPRP